MKSEFLLDPGLIFLNHGSFGACPKSVMQVYQEWQLRLEANPVEFLGRRSAALLLEARTALGSFLGACADDLAFMPNATTAFNVVARSLPLQAGDEVLSTDHEYGACENAWEFATSRAGAKLVRTSIPLPFRSAECIERIWAQVTPRTRIISVSHMTSTTALILPVAELCRRARAAGILTLVDGAHAPGQIPVDLETLGADFYVGNCHKWMCAPKGSGFLYVRREYHELVHAPVISWGYSGAVTGYAEFTAFIGKTLLEQRMQWQGTRDLAAYLSVPAAIAFLASHDWDRERLRCHERALDLSLRIGQLVGLERLCGPGDFGQMVAVPVPPLEPRALQKRLFEDYRIEVPITVHGDQMFVRVSVQSYNTESELAALETALAAIYSVGPAASGPTASR
jgi:isopenicillin-N epimerase